MDRKHGRNNKMIGIAIDEDKCGGNIVYHNEDGQNVNKMNKR